MKNLPNNTVTITIRFAKDTTMEWDGNMAYNKCFVLAKQNYLNDKINLYGFISLLEINEALGTDVFGRDYDAYVDQAKHIIAEPFEFNISEIGDDLFLKFETLY